MSSKEPEILFSSMCSNAEFEDDSDVIDALERIEDMPFPDELQNHSVEINKDNIGESEIILSEGKLSPPETHEYTCISIDVWADDEERPPKIHFHPYFENELADSVAQFISRAIGNGQLTIKSIESDLHTEFNPTNLKIIYDSSDQVDLVGYRFDHNDDHYIIQGADDGSIVRASSRPSTVVSADEIEDFISTNITKHVDFVEGIQP